MQAAVKIAEIKKHDKSKEDVNGYLLDADEILSLSIGKIDFILDVFVVQAPNGLTLSESGLSGFFYVLSGISEDLVRVNAMLNEIRSKG